jgi:hypothetical protein
MSGNVAIEQSLEEKTDHLQNECLIDFTIGLHNYHLFSQECEVVEVNAQGDGGTQFFAKFEDGREEDYRFDSEVGFREGHKVTLIYINRKGDDMSPIAGIINRTTGRFCFREEVIEDHFFPATWAEGFMRFAEGSMDSSTDFMDRHGNGFVGSIMVFCMLPIILMFFALGIALMLISLLFHGNTGKKRMSMKSRIKNYMAVAHKVEWPTKKKGFWYYTKKTLLWGGGGFIVLMLLGIL